MTEISAQLVKELRERTGAGMMECKKALVETGGNIEKAIEWLQKSGLAKAAKKADRTTNQGWIGSYVHSNGKIGVLVEVLCETDFVARNPVFQELIKDLSMHICAKEPLVVRPEELPPEVIEKEKARLTEESAKEMANKPPQIREKLIEGRLQKFFAEKCLLDQPFVKEDKVSVRDYLAQKIATIGEKITINRFVRMQLNA